MVDGIERLDSFPYRQRVRGVMGAPAQFIDRAATLREAAARMCEKRISSLLIDGGGGRAEGIVTERDVMKAVADEGAAALERKVVAFMSSPVATVPESAFLYVAIGRMDRLNFRHLVAVDGAGRAVGVVSARALLKLRASTALALDDAVAVAEGAGALKAVQAGMPALARALRDDEVSAVKIAGVVAAVLRDTTARAAELAERDLRAAGKGGPPAPYALLVLGSGGRGESLLSADQDNAIVHAGAGENDAWFAELGSRVADTLAEAGIAYCKGGVMAGKPAWCRSLDGWKQAIGGWVKNPEGENLLSVDIFYDFRRVHGDARLAEGLRRAATEAAASSPAFLRMLAANVEDAGSSLGFLGRLRTVNGRVELKKGGLSPIAAFARAAALKRAVTATGTAQRLDAAAKAGALLPDEAAKLRAAYGVLLDFVLEQQLIDIAAGRPPSTGVEIARLSRARRAELKGALKSLAGIPLLLRDVLSSVGRSGFAADDTS